MPVGRQVKLYHKLVVSSPANERVKGLVSLCSHKAEMPSLSCTGLVPRPTPQFSAREETNRNTPLGLYGCNQGSKDVFASETTLIL